MSEDRQSPDPSGRDSGRADLVEMRRQTFARCVDELTALHLKVLRFLQDTEKAHLDAGQAPPPIVFASSLSQVLKGLYPELVGQESQLNAIHNELLIRGLVGCGSLTSMITPSGARGRFTSDLGDQLLAFIAAPPDVAGE